MQREKEIAKQVCEAIVGAYAKAFENKRITADPDSNKVNEHYGIEVDTFTAIAALVNAIEGASISDVQAIDCLFPQLDSVDRAKIYCLLRTVIRTHKESQRQNPIARMLGGE